VLDSGSIFLCIRTHELSVSTDNLNWVLYPYENDIRYIDFPSTAQYLGNTTDILAYKNKIYCLFGIGGSSFAYFVEIDENLNSYSVLFTAGNVSSSRRIRRDSPFLIYNDEIYIPNYNNASAPLAYNSMGITVYDFSGKIKRETFSQPITDGFTSGQIIPHWMAIFNGRIIISVSNGQSSSGNHREVIRFNCDTLLVEEVIQLEQIITDDNSLFSDGYIYLNGEINPSAEVNFTPNLTKIKYNDFTDITIEISNYNDGYGSGASLNPIISQDTNRYKLSQFINDGNGTIPFLSPTGSSTQYLRGNGTYGTFDSTPTNLSTNPVTSTGIKSYVDTQLLLKGSLLSGNTWSGTQSFNSIYIKNGTQENGYILISDINGLATWTSSSILSSTTYWGSISGTLSNQVDLMNLINTKQNTLYLDLILNKLVGNLF